MTGATTANGVDASKKACCIKKKEEDTEAVEKSDKRKKDDFRERDNPKRSLRRSLRVRPVHIKNIQLSPFASGRVQLFAHFALVYIPAH